MRLLLVAMLLASFCLVYGAEEERGQSEASFDHPLLERKRDGVCWGHMLKMMNYAGMCALGTVCLMGGAFDLDRPNTSPSQGFGAFALLYGLYGLKEVWISHKPSARELPALLRTTGHVPSDLSRQDLESAKSLPPETEEYGTFKEPEDGALTV